MKNNSTFGFVSAIWLLLFVLSTNISLTAQTEGNTVPHQVTYQNVIAAVNANTQDAFDSVESKCIGERGQFINKLFDIFKDSKSSNLQRCATAYYLGEMRAAEAVDALASNITLNLEMSEPMTILDFPPAVYALIKIGTKSIPAVIRNLEERDDAQVRDLSLKVLYRIEGDKDLVQLRLQKALAAQKDSQKQTRLKLALKALRETALIEEMPH